MTTTSAPIGILLAIALLLLFHRRIISALIRILVVVLARTDRDMAKILELSKGKPEVSHLGAFLVFSPPGWGLRRFADFCFSKKAFTEILEPALSDMQKEHIEALAASRPWKARMVLARGYWSFWSAVVAQLPISLARRVYEIWKATKK